MASQNGWKYFYFSVFDEEWKIAKGSTAELDTVEAHFGLYNSNRLLKDAFQTLKFMEDAPVAEGQKPDAANSNGNAANANGNAAAGTSTATSPLTGVNAANSTAINENAAASPSNVMSPPTGASTPARCSTD